MIVKIITNMIGKVLTEYCFHSPSDRPYVESIECEFDLMSKENNTCINCLHCVEVCNERLLPNFLFHLAQDDEKEGLEKFNVSNCNQCGMCDSVCPVNLPLVASIKLLNDNAEKNKTDKSSAVKTDTGIKEENIAQPATKDHQIEDDFGINSQKSNLKHFEYITLFAMLPLYIGAVGRYGQKVIFLLLASVLAGLLTDTIASYLRKDSKTKWNWLAWLLIPLAMPAGVPIWIPAVGTAFALSFGKHLFGGYGKNFVNVIALAVVFVHLSYPAILVPSITKPFSTPTHGFQAYASQVSIAAPALKTTFTDGVMTSKDILFGSIPGNIGDSYPLYIIFAGLLFFLIGILDYRIPVTAIASITLFSLLGNAWYPDLIVYPHYQLLVGPVLLVLIFFSMDVWSLPRTPISRWISGFVFAFFVVLLRAFAGNAESVFFAVLLTNVFTPIIDWTIGITKAPNKVGAKT